jgi:pimeloyl-ACP methyl ester carboxylesterase
MVAVHLAWRMAEAEATDRLASLVLTDTGAATMPGREDPRQAMAPLYEGRGWEEILDRIHRHPGLFLSQLDVHPDAARLWTLYEQMVRIGEPPALAAFIRAFYDDPDPHAESLRRLNVATLVLLGEHDRLFVKPSRLLADEIPGAELVVLEGVGHMTALEAADETYAAVRAFLDAHPATTIGGEAR